MRLSCIRWGWKASVRAWKRSRRFWNGQEAIDWLYWHPDTRYFYTSWFVGAFWFVLIVLESARPRFWCRCFCPAGALLGLFSRFAFWKRHVSTNCTSCGRCSAQYPAGILKENPVLSQPSECLTCQACVSRMQPQGRFLRLWQQPIGILFFTSPPTCPRGEPSVRLWPLELILRAFLMPMLYTHQRHREVWSSHRAAARKRIF